MQHPSSHRNRSRGDTVNDHAKVAVKIINALGPVSLDDVRVLAAAQVHATLALVEQQRTANLIAAYGPIPMTDENRDDIARQHRTADSPRREGQHRSDVHRPR